WHISKERACPCVQNPRAGLVLNTRTCSFFADMPTRIVNPYGSRSLKQMRGLGDVVERMAAPIANALKLDCHDKETGELKKESPCGKRKDKLNKVFPFNSKPE